MSNYYRCKYCKADMDYVSGSGVCSDCRDHLEQYNADMEEFLSDEDDRLLEDD